MSGRLPIRLLLAATLFVGSLRAVPVPAQTPPGGIVEEDLPAEPGEASAPSPQVDAGAELPPLEQEARRAYAEGNLTRAQELYLQLADAASEPGESARLRVTAAWLAFQLDRRESARAELGRALFEYPQAPFAAEIYTPEFVALYQDALRDALDRRRRSAAQKTSRAVEAIRAGDYPAARALLLEAQELAPEDPEIQYDLALVDLRQGHAERALAGFERVLALARSGGTDISRELESRTLQSLGLLYFGRDDFETARATLEEALELSPRDARTWFNLGLTRDRLGERDAGYEALRRARDLDRRDVDIARALAVAEMDRQRWVEAISLLVQATTDRPEDPELFLQLGRAQLGLGNVEGAVASFGKARSLDPGNRLGVAVPAALLAGGTLRGRGDPVAAAEQAQAAVDLDAGSLDGWILLGLCQIDQGQPQRALEALEVAQRLAPDRADVAHNIGSARLALRDLDGAETAFRRALELDSGNEDARRVLEQIENRKAIQAAEASGGRRPPEIQAKLVSADYEPLGIRGLRVESVVAGGNAARSGLAVGDLVLRAEGQPVTRLDVLRAGKPIEIKLRAD